MLLDLIAAAILHAYYNKSFIGIFTHAVNGSFPAFFLLYHWAPALCGTALLIVYQVSQGIPGNSIDYASYASGFFVVSIMLVVASIVWPNESRLLREKPNEYDEALPIYRSLKTL